jgi:ring-1,2-phenylacetyl-CoA epoxidase subunit PaaD
MMTSTERLMQALAEVQDPELSISIVDMGLVQRLQEQEGQVTVELTLTSTGCPCADWIREDIEQRLLAEPGVREVKVVFSWERPWTPQRLTLRGRHALRQLGYAIDS